MTSAETISFDQIRERAYDLWERHHKPAGMEIEFWILAEQELRAERTGRASANQPKRGHQDPDAASS